MSSLEEEFALPRLSDFSHIEACLDYLNEHFSGLKREIFDAIQSDHALFLDTLNFASEIGGLVGSIQAKFQDVCAKADASNLRFSSLVLCRGEHRELVAREELRGKISDALLMLERVRHSLEAVSQLLHGCDYLRARRELECLEGLLADLELQFGEEPIILSSIREEVKEKRESLVQLLVQLFRGAFGIKRDLEGCFFVQTDSSADLSDDMEVRNRSLPLVMSNMHRLGILVDQLPVFVDDAKSFFSDYFLREEESGVEVRRAEEGDRVSLVVESGPSLEVSRYLESIIEVFTFLNEYIFGKMEIGGDEVRLEFGRRILPHVNGQVVRRSLERACVKGWDRDSLKMMYGGREVWEAVIRYESKLRELGYVPAGVEGCVGDEWRIDEIKRVAKDMIDQKWYKIEIFRQFRSRILMGDNSEMQWVNEDDKNDAFLVSFPKCKCRKMVVESIDLIYKILEAFFRSTPKGDASILMNTVRNLFDLFRALCFAPTPSNKKENPSAQFLYFSMALYNDCRYIIHHLSLMTIRYQPQFKQLSCPLFTLADHIQDFEKIGNRHYTQAIDRAQQQIILKLNDMNRLRKTHETAKFLKCQETIRSITSRLVAIGSLWTSLLPRDCFHAAMGRLIDQVAEYAVTSVQLLCDISKEESDRISQLFGPFIAASSQLFGEREEEAQTALRRHIRYWGKLTSLMKMFSMGIVEIGKYGQFDFTREEVVKLIKAMFADSALRRKVLNELVA